jgi:hypothetical protein
MNMAVETGKTYKAALNSFVRECGYSVAENVIVGEKIDGSTMKASLVLRPDKKRRVLVFVRTQTVSGSAEDKVPYDLLNADKVRNKGEKAFLVLSGKGWSLEKKKFFVTSLGRKLGSSVKVLSESDFRSMIVRRVV